ncbi:hypothetical protein COLO4_34406 [Corchorus olitorius]|uniref:DUF4283 domain-containing protein n=1 Tax=Corchorus olitorius TaxID=93759 RepID=A0A1R3GL12_9ROSI|nr:hypothetical protein COLO4_34406 [Corchorus olitorius]
MRECNWSNSDSSSEESADSAQNERMNVPVSEPQMKPRRSHAFSFSAEELEERRSEGQACLVGFLLDARRFSTEFIQNYINREWEIRGTATVIGRDGNKFLIHYNREIDRRVGVHANPWAIEGAIFVQQPWNPNIPLAQTTLPRIALWLQIWDLPFEYQQPLVARRMALSAGEVLQIDWEHRMPRNIRFMRVRISVDLTVPLVPGCTLERDDGSSQWVRFRYERIQKFCLNFGEIGHTHRNCMSTFEEVERKINRGLNRTSQRHGLPIVVERDTTHFSNQMRAFLTRASRRNTRIGYRQVPRGQITESQIRRTESNFQEALANIHQGLQGPQPLSINPPQHMIEDNPHQREEDNNWQQYEQNANLEEREPDDNQEEPAMTFENQEIERHSPPIQMQGEQNHVEALREIAETTPNPEENNPESGHRSLDERIERLQGELSQLMQRHPNQPNPLLECNQEGEFQNQAEYDDMMFAFTREQSRFEHICQEIIRQSDYMFTGLQMRHMNNPEVQSCQPRWINMPGGGAFFTNGKLTQETENQAESSAMAERRSRDMVEFQLNLLLNGENPEALRQVGDSFHNFQMQDATFNLYPIQEAIETEVQQQESRNKEPNHGYRCTVNEEDFVSVLLKDSPTEDEDQKQNDPQHK